ncbi:MAG TPA: nucleoside-diphosphate sugar epimerase/dehydratase [Burkholderiaceae bacterium]|nr:nucleoside-diphosphate sugar epimerase/dehydratase [Burkholderiaceae bacterium]
MAENSDKVATPDWPRSHSNGYTIWHRLDRALARLRPHREWAALLIDAVLVGVAWNATYLFRLGFERWFVARPEYDGWVMLGIVGVYAVLFRVFGVPKGIWRFSGFGEVQRLALACAAAGLLSGIIVLALQLSQVPRAVLTLHPVVTLMAVALARLSYRMLYEHARARITGSDSEIRRALVLGAGEGARLLVAGIHQQGWIVLGFLDDDPNKQGGRVAGLPVLGPLSALGDPDVLGGATHLIFAMPSVRGARRRDVLELAARAGLPVVTVPSVDELRDGNQRVDRLRDIEPEDLLGREPVHLDEEGIAATLRGKTVMITGAGGSIGSELCRQVAHHQPAKLVLYELSEFNLYSIEQDMAERFPALPVECLIGDVKDSHHVRHTMARTRPQVVFHAAAFKHVPLMEEGNALAALRNNTLGTHHAALAAAEVAAERFVLISTDKAVNPTNVMGATKRAAEMVVSALATQYPSTRFIAVRFGNVLGSSGSVIPKFKEQIARGGPVTVTHPEVIRYFMTIPEAARLVLQAAAIGETGQVLVLDMGEPVRIVDMARQLIRLAGRSADDVTIEFSGLRAGEKLYEELLADADTTVPTSVAQLRVARLTQEGATLETLLALAGTSALQADDAVVRAALAQTVPEYQSSDRRDDQ